MAMKKKDSVGGISSKAKPPKELNELDDHINQGFPYVGTGQLSNPVFNIVLYPFHHLLSAAQMMSAGSVNALTGEDRRRFFWQSLAAHGITAPEASFLDDSLNCYFTFQVGKTWVEVEWEVLFRDELQGCAEIYQAEMFVWKRLIYEAEQPLPSVIEISDNALPEFPKLAILKSSDASKRHRLFLDNLSTPFELALNYQTSDASSTDRRSAANENKRVNIDKSDPDGENLFYSYGSKRIEKWNSVTVAQSRGSQRLSPSTDSVETEQGVTGDPSDSAGIIYRLKLDSYWLDWQRAALKAGFDFPYLETLSDARALRFYELTKLWRSGLMKKGESRVPKRMDVEYAIFAALMPLPLEKSERKIKRQIDRLLAPLKLDGYLKSFAVKPARWRNGSRYARLIFRFND